MCLHCDPIRDEGQSGTGFNREGIKRILALSQEDEVTHLIVDHVDRIGRSTPETLMFIQLLRKRGVTLMSRSETLDMLVPSDRMRITFLAMMADFATMHRSRSANRSKIQAVIDDKQWTSWFHTPPLGYEMDGDGWITVRESMRPVIEDVYQTFLDTETYAKTAREVNDRHENEIESTIKNQRPDRDDAELDGSLVKEIVTRRVYVGQPTVPAEDIAGYDTNPFVEDDSLRIVSDETFNEAQDVVVDISQGHSSNEGDTDSVPDFVEKFGPFAMDVASAIVNLDCPKCGGDFIADGQRDLNGDAKSRMYRCVDCGHNREFPRDDEYERMKIIDKLSEFVDKLY